MSSTARRSPIFSLPDPHLTTLTQADIDLMPPSEIRCAFAIAQEVNPDFFEMRQRGKQGTDGAVGQLEDTAVALAAHGHSNIWSYPWSVFLKAIDYGIH